jgi:hypothetical protein
MNNLHADRDETSSAIASKLLEAIEGIRYGSVEIIIHDRKIVQIERKEKVRFDVTLPPRH